MKLRSMAALVLALVLCWGCASADTTVVSTGTATLRSASLNTDSNTLAICGEGSDYYQIVDVDGYELNDKKYVKCTVRQGMYEVAVQSGLNVLGLTDGQGRELVPMAYGDVIQISDRWQLGIVLADAAADNYDYKAFSGDAFYLTDRVDVFFNGQKVGELGRMDYKQANAYGDYLQVTSREGVKSYYDKNFALNSQGEDLYGEYLYDYKTKTNLHLGSGQVAFVPGCTLMPDEVEESIYNVSGQFFDLQGNLLFVSPKPYDTIYGFEGDYAKVRWNNKYGMINKDGVEVLPCEYDSIDAYDNYFSGGYLLVVKDGKAGYVNTRGEVTCDFKYAAKALKSSYKSPFTHLPDMEGNMVVLSAAAGVLPETYKEVRIEDGCPVFAAVNMEGYAGVVDLYGNAVIPFDGTYDSMYDFTISDDGTVVLAYKGSREYVIYQLSHGESTAAAENEPAGQVSAADGDWFCVNCGTANSGKFCTECGTAKPADTAPKCTNCGYEPDGTPKFCPECGTKF